MANKKKKSTNFIKKLIDVVKGKLKPKEVEGVDGVKNFKFGFFYTFKYKAETPIKTIKFYDTHPIMLPLNKIKLDKGTGILGINFNWIPQKHRKDALKLLLRKAKSGNSIKKMKKGKPVKLDYSVIKKDKKLYEYFKYAIRSYYVKNAKNILKLDGADLYENIEYNEAEVTGSKKDANQAIKEYNTYLNSL